jgi:hypothetical protein
VQQKNTDRIRSFSAGAHQILPTPTKRSIKAKKIIREPVVGAYQIRGFPKGGVALVEGSRRRFDPNPFGSPADIQFDPAHGAGSMGKRGKGFGDAPRRRRSRAAADLVELCPPLAESLARSQVTVVCGRNASRGQEQPNCRFSLFPCILPGLYSWPIGVSTVPIGQPNWLCLSRYLAYWSQPHRE